MNDKVYVPATPGALPEAAQNLQNKGKLDTSLGQPPTHPRAGGRLKLRGPTDIAGSLHVAPPGAGRATQGFVTQDLNNAVMELDIVDQMMAYDHNPRTELNPAYNEIKDSIRQRGGLSGTLMVTRRPGETRYMPYMGQNTRFAALLELWTETEDPRFRKVRVVYREWKSESDTLLSHVVENEVRGNTCWFDKARAIVDFRKLLERERGVQLSAADIESATREAGMAVSRPIVALYEYAVDTVAPLGVWLTQENVAAIRAYQATLSTIADSLALQTAFVEKYQAACPSIFSAARADLDSAASSEGGCALRGRQLSDLLERLTTAFCLALGIEPTRFPHLKAAVAEGASTETITSILHGTYSNTPKDPPASPTASHERGSPKVASRSVSIALTPSPAPSAAPQSNPPADRDGGGTTAVDVESGPTQVLHAMEPTADDVGGRFGEALHRFCDATFTRDFLCTDPDLAIKYGFWLEVPLELFGGEVSSILDVPTLNGRALSPAQAALRASAYRMLAFLSGQLGGSIGPTEQDFARALPEESLWRQAVLADFMSEDSFLAHWQHQFHGAIKQDPSAVVLVPQWHDLTALLHAPECQNEWVAFLAALQAWHQVRVLQPTDAE